MESLSKRAESYSVSTKTFERWMKQGAPVGSESQMVTWLSKLHRKTSRVKTWLKNQGVEVAKKNDTKPTHALDCAEAFRNYYALKLESAINDEDHCSIKFWNGLFVEVDNSIRMAEIKAAKIRHKETVREKRATAYKNLKRTLKHGDVREDGMVFDCYASNLFKSNFERWVTPEKLASIDKKHKEWADTKTPPSARTLEVRKKKKELSKAEFLKWRRDTSNSGIKKKTCPIEKRKAAARTKANYEKIKADPDRLSAYKKTKAKAASKRYHKKLKNSPIAKLERSVRSRLNKRMKSKGTKFTKNFDKMIGCTPEFLQNHIESQFSKKMTWKNWGPYWELDHIRPIASFDLTIEKEYLAANHYTNLQPLEKTKNNIKSDDWDGQTEMLAEIL